MTIKTVELFRYTLPLVEAMRIKDHTLITRSGIVVKMTDDAGNAGYGEIAPLLGYSRETIDEAAQQAIAFAPTLVGQAIPEGIERLDGGFDRWLGSALPAPSARFGYELAVLSLLACRRQIPLRRLFSNTAADAIQISALLSGNLGEIRKKAEFLKREGYRAVKLKVGRYDLDTDIQTTTWLSDHLGDGIALRLDANRAWDLDTAAQFAHAVSVHPVGYIEEPVSDPHRLTEFAAATGMPVALDETLQDLTPEDLRPMQGVKAVILKPTVLGLEKAARIGRKAREIGLLPVVSATYESGLGLSALAAFAAAIHTADSFAGLDTYEWLDADILMDRLPLRRPLLDATVLAECATLAQKLDDSRLQKIDHA